MFPRKPIHNSTVYCDSHLFYANYAFPRINTQFGHNCVELATAKSENVVSFNRGTYIFREAQFETKIFT